MCKQFEAETTAICMEQIGAMLNEFQSSPAEKWAAKDAAVSDNYSYFATPRCGIFLTLVSTLYSDSLDVGDICQSREQSGSIAGE
jgi:hypothetical protein